MPRFARLVIPGYPHHITQRGSRKQRTFFDEEDYSFYLDLLAEQLPRSKSTILAYCLMPNHVHLIVVPRREDSLARLLRRTHAEYARRINSEHDWQGHLWQERFHSCVMDEPHLIAAARYVELNPVRARLCHRPDEWNWSSVHFHLHGRTDRLIKGDGMKTYVDDWESLLADIRLDDRFDDLRRQSRTGRPAGSSAFVRELEVISGRRLTRRKPGRKRK